MVKSYSKNANHNMRRPIINEDILYYLRHEQKENEGFLKELEKFADEENIPIIPSETVSYFRFFLQTMQPKKILEIGTAIGFSALLMAESAPCSKITTIDRNPEMIALAQKNFREYDQRRQITLLEGDAADLLNQLDETYDLFLLDSAKAKYIVFLPQVLKHLEVGGVIFIDDIFQGGDLVKTIEKVHRNQRAIYRGLHRLLDATLKNPGLTASLLPLGDGLLVIRKNNSEITLTD